MNRLLAGLLAGSLLGTVPAISQQSSADPRLGWMAGCWELRAGSRVIHEHWIAPLGGMMLGMSRTVVRDTTREFEQIRIEAQGDKISYIAHPSGQEETAFLAVTLTDTLVVFSNPAHDFPQRVIYRARGADSLIARIEGDQNGQVRGMNFPMGRISCGG